MSLPVNFSGFSGEELYHHFRNVCIEFKKKIKSSKDITDLEQEMQRFIHTSKQLDWRHKNSGVYRKDESAKALEKVGTEYIRYMNALKHKASDTGPQYLLAAITEVEKLIDSLKAS